MNSKVLLVQPPFTGGTPETMCIPLGLAWIASTLQQYGIEVAVLDLLLSDLDWQTQLNEAMRDGNVGIMGVQFHSTMSFTACCEFVKHVRQTWPGVYLVAGGETAGCRAYQLLEENLVDFVVEGEGEETFRFLVQLIQEQGGQAKVSSVPGGFMRNPNGSVEYTGERPLIACLDSLPLPARDLFRWREYPQWSIFTSRGCPFRCTFCSASAWWRHAIRYRSNDSVLVELKLLRSKYEVQNVYIGDDNFTFDRNRTRDLCSSMIREGLDMKWSCLTRGDSVDEPLLRLMKEAGCVEISYGLESANDQTLSLVNKGETSEQIRTAILMSRRLGIDVRVTVIIGLPHETVDDVRNTLRFLHATQPNEIQIYSLAAYDGTALFGDISQLGVRILEDDPAKWTRNVLTPMCETDLLDRNQIRSLGLEFVDSLVAAGYTYFHSSDSRIKGGLDKVVYTGFCPVQSIPDARRP